MVEKKSTFLARYLPAFWASGILLITLAILYARMLTLTDNHFVYALDDAYIHIAISQNMVENGNYGPTPYAFEPASSSLIWNFLLAGIFLITGVNISVPFILNIILGVLTVFILQKILLDWFPDQKNWIYTLILIAFVFFIPLPAMIFSGMEHNLQILLSILVVYFTVEMLTTHDAGYIKRLKYALAIALTLLFTVRFEAVFLASVVIGLLILKRHIRFAIMLGILNLLPIVAASLFFVGHDRSIFPNSVWAKALDSKLLSFSFTVNGLNVPSLLLFYLAALSYFWRYYCRNKQLITWNRMHLTLLIASGVGLQHLFISNFGWFFRYEAYLIALMGLAYVLVIKEFWHTNSSFTRNFPEMPLDQNRPSAQTANTRISRTMMTVASAILVTLLSRAYFTVIMTPNAARDIYSSAYHTGLFLDQYYSGQTVILNDIGYPSYYADIHLLDLSGLGSYDWLNLMRTGRANQQTMQLWADKARAEIAVTYSSYTVSSKTPQTQVPENWILVGQWKITHSIVVIKDDVWNLYAMNNDYAAALHQHLVEFADDLPKGVEFVDLFAE